MCPGIRHWGSRKAACSGGEGGATALAFQPPGKDPAGGCAVCHALLRAIGFLPHHLLHFGCGSLGTDRTGPLEGRVIHRTQAASTAPNPQHKHRGLAWVLGPVLLGTWAASSSTPRWGSHTGQAGLLPSLGFSVARAHGWGGTEADCPVDPPLQPLSMSGLALLGCIKELTGNSMGGGNKEQREAPPPPLDAVLSHSNCSSVGPNGGALGCYLHLLLCICASGLQVGQAGATPGPSPPPGRGVPCCSLSLYLAIWDIGTNTGCGARDNVPVAYACQLSWSLCPVPILLDPSSGPVFWDPALLTLVPRTSLFVSRQSSV